MKESEGSGFEPVFLQVDLNMRVFILESDKGNTELGVSTETQCWASGVLKSVTKPALA